MFTVNFEERAGNSSKLVISVNVWPLLRFPLKTAVKVFSNFYKKKYNADTIAQLLAPLGEQG